MIARPSRASLTALKTKNRTSNSEILQLTERADVQPFQGRGEETTPYQGFTLGFGVQPPCGLSSKPSNRRLALALIFLVPIGALASSVFITEESSTEAFAFKSSGMNLDGIISRPKNTEASSIVIMVHGYGRTNVVTDNWYRELRSSLLLRGFQFSFGTSRAAEKAWGNLI